MRAAVPEVLHHVLLIIAELLDLPVAEPHRRIPAESVHHRLDFRGSLDALHRERYLGLLVIAILLIDVQHLIPECQPLLLVERRGLTEHHDRDRCILVAGVRPGKAAVGLLQAEHIVVAVILLKQLDLLADILEAGQRLHIMQPVFCRHGARQIGGHDRGDKGRVLRHRVILRPLAENILPDEHAGHIAGEGHIFAGLRILCIDAETVCIRIRRQYDVRVDLFRQLQRQCKRLRILRIRIRKRGEIRVRILLFRYDIDMPEAELLQHALDRNQSRAVERRVDDPDVVRHLPDHLRMDDLLLDRGHIGVVHLAAEINQQTGLLRLFLRHGLHRVKIFDSQHIRDDAGVMRRRDLCAVLPVYLVAVVLRRVVRSGDLDARLAVEIAQGEGFLRHRPQRV